MQLIRRYTRPKYLTFFMFLIMGINFKIMSYFTHFILQMKVLYTSFPCLRLQTRSQYQGLVNLPVQHLFIHIYTDSFESLGDSRPIKLN